MGWALTLARWYRVFHACRLLSNPHAWTVSRDMYGALTKRMAWMRSKENLGPWLSPVSDWQISQSCFSGIRGVQGCICRQYCRRNTSSRWGTGSDRQPLESRKAKLSSSRFENSSSCRKLYDEIVVCPLMVGLRLGLSGSAGGQDKASSYFGPGDVDIFWSLGMSWRLGLGESVNRPSKRPKRECKSYRWGFPRREQTWFSCRHRVQGLPRRSASHLTLRAWHHVHAADALFNGGMLRAYEPR